MEKSRIRDNHPESATLAVSGTYDGVTKLKAKMNRKVTKLPDFIGSPKITHKNFELYLVLRMKKLSLLMPR
jgi:hypothetical protein